MSALCYLDIVLLPSLCECAHCYSFLIAYCSCQHVVTFGITTTIKGIPVERTIVREPEYDITTGPVVHVTTEVIAIQTVVVDVDRSPITILIAQRDGTIVYRPKEWAIAVVTIRRAHVVIHLFASTIVIKCYCRAIMVTYQSPAILIVGRKISCPRSVQRVSYFVVFIARKL